MYTLLSISIIIITKEVVLPTVIQITWPPEVLLEGPLSIVGVMAVGELEGVARSGRRGRDSTHLAYHIEAYMYVWGRLESHKVLTE